MGAGGHGGIPANFAPGAALQQPGGMGTFSPMYMFAASGAGGFPGAGLAAGIPVGQQQQFPSSMQMGQMLAPQLALGQLAPGMLVGNLANAQRGPGAFPATSGLPPSSLANAQAVPEEE